MTGIISYSQKRNQKQSSLPANVEPTETERAFNLVGEDTAMSFEDWNESQNVKREGQTQAVLDEYLSKLDPEDAAYQREQLSQLPENSMLDIIYDEDRDSVKKYMDPESAPAKEREFVMKSVPRAIAPYVRVVAKGAGFVVVKPLEEIEPVIAEGIAKAISDKRAEDISQGTELTARGPSLRQKHRRAIANLLEKTGAAGNSRRAYDMAGDFVGDPEADSFLASLGAADITPLGALYAADEGIDEVKALNQRQDASAVDYIAPVAVTGLAALEAFPVTKGLARIGKRALRGDPIQTPVKTIDEIRVEVDALRATGEAKKRADKAKSKFDLGAARKATDEVEAAKKEAARKAASDEEGQQLTEEILLDYQENLRNMGVLGEDETIVRKAFGKTVLDFEKARNVGKSRLDDLNLPDDEVSELGFGPDGYRSAVLNPDLLDKFVAVIKQVRKTNPDLIKDPTKKRGITEQVYKASVGDAKLLQSDELMEALDKYGLSFEDFVLQVNAGASVAGKVLNRSMQMGRSVRKSQAQIDEQELMEDLNKMSGFGKGVTRFGNVLRGALVGTLATAMRNFEGFLVRRPLEGLSTLFENGIHAVATGGLKALKPDTFRKSYGRSMRTMGEMFRDRKGIQEYTDFILKRKEFDAEFKQMFEQVNEIRLGLGRGEATTKVGQKADWLLSRMEDYVHFANAPNRMQEFLARRTAFFDRLETLVKREYNLDVMDIINSGRFNDLLRDSSDLVGKDKRSFKELVGDSVKAATDQTYASNPDNDFLKSLLRVFNKTGVAGKLVLPFPRFMLKAGEYMYDTTLGLPASVTKKIFGMATKTDVGRMVDASGAVTYNGQMAARGMAGWSAIGGMYMAAEAGLITEDNKIVLPGGKKLDVTYQFPLAQFVWLGKALQKAMSSEKDFTEWYDGREARDLFMGVNFRANTGLGELMDDVFKMMNNEAKAGRLDKSSEAAGKFVADRLLWIAQPYQQVIDLERGLGFRDTTVRSYSSDPMIDNLPGSFKKGALERVQQRGYTTQEGGLTGFIGDRLGLGMEEGDIPAPYKAYATKPGGKDRGQLGSLFKFGFGLNIMDRFTEEQAFLKKYGFNDWDFASRTGVGTVDNAINETISGILPSLTRQLQRAEERFIEQGKSDAFIKKEIKARTIQLFKDVKNKIYAGREKLKTAGANDPVYVKELFKLRRLTAEAQAAIQERYYEANGKYPDLSKTEDVIAMLKIARKGRYNVPLLR